MTADGSPGPLPPPIPPHPRERPVVGEGLHRVGQRHPGRAVVPGPRPTPSARRIRLLRPAGPRGAGGPGRPGPAHGVTGFCYWHYWFAGHRLLQRPFDEVVAAGAPRLPLLRGLGQPELVRDLARGAEQDARWNRPTPVPDDDLAHFAYLGPHSRTPATSESPAGRCLFIYQAGDLPEPARFVEVAEDGPRRRAGGPVPGGFLGESSTRSQVARWIRCRRPLRSSPSAVTPRPGCGSGCGSRASSAAPSAIPMRTRPPRPTRRHVAVACFPSVYPNWDNTPRMGRRAWWPPGRRPSASGPRAAGRRAGLDPSGGRAAPDDQVVERMGGGQLSRARRRVRRGRLEALRTEAGTGGGAAASRERGSGPGPRAACGRCPRSPRAGPGDVEPAAVDQGPCAQAGPEVRVRHQPFEGVGQQRPDRLVGPSGR